MRPRTPPKKNQPRRQYDWHDYEAAKREWKAKNPNATCEEYSRAMLRIADSLGL